MATTLEGFNPYTEGNPYMKVVLGATELSLAAFILNGIGVDCAWPAALFLILFTVMPVQYARGARVETGRENIEIHLKRQ